MTETYTLEIKWCSTFHQIEADSYEEAESILLSEMTQEEKETYDNIYEVKDK